MATARLRAVLGLDSKEFQAGVRGAGNQATSFQRQIQRVGAAIGIAFSAAAVIRMGRALLTWASDISLAARNVGILTSEMAALNEVAVQSGMQTRDLQSIMGRLEGELFGAVNGTQELKAIYGELGLTLDQLFSGDTDPVKRLQMVGRAALESANPTGALAQIFGQRLGPNARVALESIVEGMTDVDRATGDLIDTGERLGSYWARQGEAAKRISIQALGWLADIRREASAGLGASIASPGDLLTREGRDRITASAQAMLQRDEDKIAKTRDLSDMRRAAGERELARLAAARAQAEQAAADAKVQSEQDINDEIRRRRLEGLDRMAADHQVAIDEIKSQMETAGDKERQVLQRRMDMIRDFYDQDVERFKQAQDEKAQAQLDTLIRPLQNQLDRLREQSASIAASTTGTGVTADSMARIGGMMGGERAGLAVLDRQLRVQSEIARNTQGQLEILRRIEELERSSATGGLGDV